MKKIRTKGKKGMPVEVKRRLAPLGSPKESRIANIATPKTAILTTVKQSTHRALHLFSGPAYRKDGISAILRESG